MSLFRYRNRTSKWFTALIRPLLWIWFKRRFRVELDIDPSISQMDGPFVLIGNHVTFWDPFMIAIPIKPDTRFITSDNVFRTRFFRWVMAQVGAIPKTKGVANADIVRRIVGVIKQKGVIGIFPEARRTWDGRSLTLVPQVPKLVARLKLPVVAARITGGYLSGPRWGRYGRTGRVRIEYSLAISPEEAGSLSADEVSARMADAIRFDPNQWQQSAQIPFRGRRLAEYLERVLFLCPDCGEFGTLRSERDIFSCSACGHTARYLETGLLEPVKGERRFETVAAWNDWQIEELYRRIDALSDGSPPLFEDKSARLLQGFMSKPMQLIDRGSVAFERDAVVFRSNSGNERRFPLTELDGTNVQNGEKIEFYWNKQLYRLDFENPRVAAYKWLRTILYCQGKGDTVAPL